MDTIHIPNASQQLFLQGNDLFDTGRYTEAIAYYDCAMAKPSKGIAIAFDRNFPTAQSNRELALKQLDQPLKKRGQPVAAMAKPSKGIASEQPETVYTTGGVVLPYQDRRLEAIAAYEKVLAIDPGNHQAWRNRGVCLYNLRRHEEAITSFEKAIAIAPNDWEARRNLGIALYDLGKYEEAIAAHDQAIAINPNDPDTWYSRGLALDDLGNHDEAEKSYSQAAIIEPGFDENCFFHDLFIT
jgi:tetratricopeptide (TPR) repeat protein